jgi:hypothetical protein
LKTKALATFLCEGRTEVFWASSWFSCSPWCKCSAQGPLANRRLKEVCPYRGIGMESKQTFWHNSCINISHCVLKDSEAKFSREQSQ